MPLPPDVIKKFGLFDFIPSTKSRLHNQSTCSAHSPPNVSPVSSQTQVWSLSLGSCLLVCWPEICPPWTAPETPTDSAVLWAVGPCTEWDQWHKGTQTQTLTNCGLQNLLAFFCGLCNELRATCCRSCLKWVKTCLLRIATGCLGGGSLL